MKKLSFLALALSSSVTLAQNNQNYLLVNVEVSANRTSQSLLRTTNAVDVIDESELDKTGEDQIPLMLKKQPGITVQTDGTPGIYTVSIRQEQPSRTVYVSDGVRMSDQKSRQGMPLLYNPFFVKRVEIIRGASSVLYGSDAQAGIISVVSKDPEKRPLALDTGIIFNSQGNGFTELLNASGTLEKLSYIAGVTHTDMGDRYVGGHKRIDNTSYYQSGVNSKVMYQLSDKLQLGFNFDYFDINASTATTTRDPDYSGFKMRIPNWNYKKASIFTNSLNINDTLTEFKTRFYQSSENKEFSQDTGSYSTKVHVDNNEDAKGANIQGELSFGEYLKASTGYDLRQELSDGITTADLSNNPVSKMGYAPLKTSSSNSKSRQDSHALYSLFTLFPYERLNFEYGVRWNHFSSKSGDNISAASYKYKDITVSGAHSRKTSVKTVQSAGILYKLTYNSILRAHYSEGFKVPSLSQLFMTSYSGRTIEPNTNLKPESSKNYEIGMRYDGDDLTLDTDIFYTTSDNYIDISRYSTSPERYHYRNVAKAESFGTEVKFSYHIESFSPYVNLTAMRRKFTHENISTYDSGTPEFFGSAGIKFTGKHSLGDFYADAYIIFASDAKEDPALGQNSLIKNDLDISGYTTFNLSFGSGVYSYKNTSIKVFCSINNIFDKLYRTSVYIDEPGRYFTLGIKASM
ncbi:MAG: TonB-dependent receptor plug domain-containing protein [Succinivibrio sp.]